MSAKPIGPYRPIVRAGDWLLVSGQLGAVDGVLVGGGLTGELEQAITNLSDLLAGEGASLSQVVATTVYLRHMSDYGSMNEIYARHFGDVRPARSAFAVGELPLGALVEIDARAYLGA